MCDILQIPRSTYYYDEKVRDDLDEELTGLIVEIFRNSRDICDQRKTKRNLKIKDGKFHAAA